MDERNAGLRPLIPEQSGWFGGGASPDMERLVRKLKRRHVLRRHGKRDDGLRGVDEMVLVLLVVVEALRSRHKLALSRDHDSVDKVIITAVPLVEGRVVEASVEVVVVVVVNPVVVVVLCRGGRAVKQRAGVVLLGLVGGPGRDHRRLKACGNGRSLV